ncbi:MAG: methionine--tRNA ligase [Candidatus Obscuribacterales bacterium]|nr:methionine--tRNA ligase [Candidatus Obscuribacterales bacterium]
MKYYVTTAIDYANAAPHIGHAYEKIAADIVARYQRMLGKEVFFLTGTDEHGIKVEKAAAAAGKSPQEFVDEIAAKFQNAWKLLNISNDYFIRTTEERHKKVVQAVFAKMREKGDVYKGSYKGLYCEGCEDFWRERDLKDGKCPNHLREPKVVEEENYFFRLSKYKDAVREWLTSSQEHVKPDGRRLEVLNQLEDPELGDFSCTRSRGSLSWGIPVPDEPDQVIYVWIDALTNYITGAGYNTDESAWKKWWPADLHLIGKDITKFHAIYWPAMLLSIDVELPNLVFGHGFITVEGQKMSKTLGNVLDPVYLTETYKSDSIRYFLFEANTFDQDGDFSRQDMINKVNSHLANGLGNLLNRAIKLLETNFEGKVPELPLDPAMLKSIEESSRKYHEFMEEMEFAKAIKVIFEGIVDEANRYVNDRKPWTLFKEGKKDEGGIVLATVMAMLKRAALLLSPFTPNLSNDIWEQLGFDLPLNSVSVESEVYKTAVPANQAVRNRGPVFQRLEEPGIEASAGTKK